LALRRERHNTPHKSPGGGQEQTPLTTTPLPPSRLGGGNTKRNKNLAAKDHPSATKMQTYKHNALGSLNLTLDSQPSKGDEWEGVCSAHKDVKMFKRPRGIPWSRPPHIYKPQKNRAVSLTFQHTPTAPDAQVPKHLTLLSVRSPTHSPAR
jgi:hypothetical protein